jgi:Protein of unknown function (DUF3396)
MTEIDRLTALSFTAGGHLRLVPCMRVTLYLDTIQEAQFSEYCAAALALLRPKLVSYQSGSMKRPAAMADKSEDIVPSWLRRPRPGQTYFVEFTGAEGEGTSPATLRVVMNYAAPTALSPEESEVRRERRRVLYEDRGAKLTSPVSEITLTVPLDMEIASPSQLSRWMLQRPLITTTAFASGHAGLGLNRDSLVADMGLSDQIRGRLAYAVVRHPGLDWQKDNILDRIMRYDRGSRDLVPQIKRVNWLTLTSSRTLELLGERAEVNKRIVAAAGVATYPLSNGLLIQAGPEPALGDSSIGELPAAYCHVGYALRSVRLASITGAGGSFSDEQAERWLTAFDEERSG